jgi:threonine synthase
MRQMMHYAAQRGGMLIALEAAATLAAYHTLLTSEFLKAEDEVVVFFTGSGLTDILASD